MLNNKNSACNVCKKLQSDKTTITNCGSLAHLSSVLLSRSQTEPVTAVLYHSKQDDDNAVTLTSVKVKFGFYGDHRKKTRTTKSIQNAPMIRSIETE